MWMCWNEITIIWNISTVDQQCHLYSKRKISKTLWILNVNMLNLQYFYGGPTVPSKQWNCQNITTIVIVNWNWKIKDYMMDRPSERTEREERLLRRQRMQEERERQMHIASEMERIRMQRANFEAERQYRRMEAHQAESRTQAVPPEEQTLRRSITMTPRPGEIGSTWKKICDIFCAFSGTASPATSGWTYIFFKWKLIWSTGSTRHGWASGRQRRSRWSRI